MREITITYHRDEEGWWFESDDIPGWTGGDVSLSAARRLAEEGARFALETSMLEFSHRLAAEEPAPLEIDWDKHADFAFSNAASDVTVTEVEVDGRGTGMRIATLA